MGELEHFLSGYISVERIQARVREMGRQISEDYAGKSLVAVGVLKGSFVFLADLMREIALPVEISFISLSSYASGTASSGAVRLVCDIDIPLRGRDVLVVEDIIDSGYTVRFLLDTFQVRRPASLKVCAMLDKPSRRMVDVKADYRGFEIENEFVVGYGLDFAGLYRNLPGISVVKFK